MAVKKTTAKKKSAVKKATKKTAKKKSTANTSSTDKFSFVDEVLNGVLETAEISPRGEIKLKKSEMKSILESAMESATKAAARGDRVKFPWIGTLMRKDVPARKAGKTTNPFTGEPMTVSARAASMKPRWSFPKATKDLFADKKNWK